MADQDSQRGSFWTSLPGILTGAAALITAISGLAIWHNSSASQSGAAPAQLVQQPAQQQPSSAASSASGTEGAVQQTAQPKAGAMPSAPTTPSVPIGSQQWCSEKYTAWQSKKTQTGVDDAGLRKEITQAHCNQFGFKLGRVKEQK